MAALIWRPKQFIGGKTIPVFQSCDEVMGWTDGFRVDEGLAIWRICEKIFWSELNLSSGNSAAEAGRVCSAWIHGKCWFMNQLSSLTCSVFPPAACWTPNKEADGLFMWGGLFLKRFISRSIWSVSVLWSRGVSVLWNWGVSVCCCLKQKMFYWFWLNAENWSWALIGVGPGYDPRFWLLFIIFSS